jgi:hypothetical protein
VLLHSLCHRHTHATLAAAELVRDDVGMAALRGHPRLAAPHAAGRRFSPHLH